jgi:hypothetical protein
LLDYPKAIKKKLRKLVGEAYENELVEELTKLEAKFAEWRAGKIYAGDLSYLIHKYDTGPSREMYKYYNGVSPALAVGRAVAEGLLEREDIPEDVWPYIEAAVEIHRRYAGNEDNATTT